LRKERVTDRLVGAEIVAKCWKIGLSLNCQSTARQAAKIISPLLRT
jgi:hypothetical protein